MLSHSTINNFYYIHADFLLFFVFRQAFFVVSFFLYIFCLYSEKWSEALITLTGRLKDNSNILRDTFKYIQS